MKVLLGDLGIDAAVVVRRARLPGDLFSGGPRQLSQRDFFALWDAIEAEAGLDLPLRLADAFSAEVFDPAVFAALASPDLNVAAQRIATHKKLIGPMKLDVAITASETALHLRWPGEDHPPATLMLSELVFWVALTRMATRERIEPTRVTTPVPPAEEDPYRDYFGVAVSSDSDVSITFSAADATLPFVMANESMWEAFQPMLQKRMAELEAEDTFTDRVRAALIESLPSGQSSMAAVGSRLAVSTRTLQRRLGAEDTRFQDLLNETRASLARHYLTTTEMPAAEVAFLLGYDDPTSFYRAFQSWTGQTPAQVRAEPVKQ